MSEQEPKDMWEETPKSETPVEKDPVTGMEFGNRGYIESGVDQIIRPKRKFGWVAPAVIIAVILAGGGFYALNQNNTTPPDNNPANESPTATGVSVSWKNPIKLSNLNLLLAKDESGEELFQETPTYWEVGSVTDGTYTGADVVIATARAMGPSFFADFYHFIVTADKAYLIQGTDGIPPIKNEVEVISDIILAGLAFPAELTSPNNSSQKLKLVNFSGNQWFSERKNLKQAFVEPTFGTVYMDSLTQTIPVVSGEDAPEGGFYLKAPDGTLRAYALVIPFPLGSQVPGVVWKDGSKNSDEYTITDFTGCGSFNQASVMPASLQSDLVDAGSVSIVGKKETIWELDSYDHILITSAYDTYKSSFGGSEPVGTQTPMSLTAFANQHPMFFWKDSFGRIIKFQNNKYLPGAECGKPVIYLYPKEKSKVKVQVVPQGGMTISIPDYGNGWDVWADPQGVITNISDGIVYPYLFWEGRGGMYKSPDMGWVVSQNDVDKTITEKLTLYGLNHKEITDFKEFWIPRMQVSPYYFISFYGTSEMNRLAPLTITPKPDTIIRVLMDFKELKAPMAVEPYQIRTIPRTGFTVIEWGGVLR